MHCWSIRNVDKSDEHFEKCVKSLEEEIMFVAGNILTIQEPTCVPDNTPDRKRLKRKLGRGFRHALTQLYLRESGSVQKPLLLLLILRFDHHHPLHFVYGLGGCQVAVPILDKIKAFII